jgi:hypothetical protein
LSCCWKLIEDGDKSDFENEDELRMLPDTKDILLEHVPLVKKALLITPPNSDTDTKLKYEVENIRIEADNTNIDALNDAESRRIFNYNQIITERISKEKQIQ